MAIQQHEIIKAFEIKAEANINVTSGNYIKATDISGLYSGSDTIAPGVLIKAEHFTDIGIPGTGGLNGTYGGYSFREAIDKNWIEYDSNNRILKILKSSNSGSTLKFTNFGGFSPATNIFMIGGGGAGNKNGSSGTGGFYPKNNYETTLKLNEIYSLTIGSGGTTSGASGNKTTGFGYTADGGIGGKRFTIEGYYRNWTTKSNHTYHYTGREQYSTTIDGTTCRVYTAYRQLQIGEIVKFACDEQGNLTTEPFTFRYENDQLNGEIMLGFVRADGGSTREVYRPRNVDGNPVEGTLSDIIAESSPSTRPTNEMPGTKAFNLITVGGPGSSSSASNGTNPGQGGGSTNNALGTTFGKGANGIILIKFTNK